MTSGHYTSNEAFKVSNLYINYEYLQWKNRPIESASPILGAHKNSIKPIQSFQQMLSEKYCLNDGSVVPNQTKANQPEDALSSSKHFSEITTNIQNNEFKFQLIPENDYDLHPNTHQVGLNYSDQIKGARSMPQSPLLFPKISHNVNAFPNTSHAPPALFNEGRHFGNQPNAFIKQSYMRSPELHSSVTSHMPNTSSPMNSKRFTGRLKFFDETQNYGFFVLDIDNSDLFVHFEDLRKAGLNKEFLKAIRENSAIKFSFNCVTYYGKYSLSRKAINVEYYCEQTKPPY